MTATAVAPGTVVVYSDIACPWAHLAMHRLHATRARLGLDSVVTFEPRAYPLEVVNERPTSRRGLDSEIPVVAALEPDAGWRTWRSPADTYPVTTVPALAAVQAARFQSGAAGEALDMALRHAMFVDSRCISVRSIILDVAEATRVVDVGAVADELDSGRAHAAVMSQWREAQSIGVIGSPHVFAGGVLSLFNPGVKTEQVPVKGEHFVRVLADDPAVYEEILNTAAGH